MPAAKADLSAIQLVAGDDEFTIKETAGRLSQQMATAKAGEFGLEIIEAETGNQDLALKAIGRVREALFTIGFFGGDKLVWWKNTELLADTPTTRGEAVKEALVELGSAVKEGLPAGTRLLISAIGCDRRRTFFKTLEKLGQVHWFELPDPDKERDPEEVAKFIQGILTRERKKMGAEALAAFLGLVAAEPRELVNELGKLCTYVGLRGEITAADVRAICSASRESRIWDLTDSLGARHLPAALRTLESLLQAGEQPIGVLMLLASQFRLMLLGRDLADRKVLVPRDEPRGGFAYIQGYQKLAPAQLAHLPKSKEGKPPNPWRLYRCALAARNFSYPELVRAMELLLEANLELVSTQLDARLVLEETITRIARKASAA